jgi:hypothetical protein
MDDLASTTLVRGRLRTLRVWYSVSFESAQFWQQYFFDSRASHSFISSSFVEKHNIPKVLVKFPLITRTPWADIQCHLGCSRVRINLSGVEFLADLVVLKSKGIDVILGMDWLSLHDGHIGCPDKVVHQTNPDGV